MGEDDEVQEISLEFAAAGDRDSEAPDIFKYGQHLLEQILRDGGDMLTMFRAEVLF